MTVNAEAARARRYLLGHASDEESAELEQEYLTDEDALDRMAAAEDDLIEDYLAGQLDAGDRDRFERSYLSAPEHRVRVETIRALVTRGQRSAGTGSSSGAADAAPRSSIATFEKKREAQTGWRRRAPLLAMAASLLMVTATALWISSGARRPAAEVAQGVPQSAPTQPRDQNPPTSNTPRTFALTISPVAVRSGSDSPASVMPKGTDLVVVRLEGDADVQGLTARRAAIRTVAGREVWQGTATAGANLPRGIAARVEVPAASVPPDDYLLTLYGTDRAGVEREWAQYFLRLRSE